MKTNVYQWGRLRSALLGSFILVFLYSPLFSQEQKPHFCAFDEILKSHKKNGQDGINIENEMKLQEALTQFRQSKSPGQVFEVPVVFHVIHQGEPIGVGSNIPDGQVLTSLQNLNDRFRDVQGVGHDVEINFCLAQRDPLGSNSTGINRVDGTVIPSYGAGININGGNESAIKALSIWPSGDCINIWIVHNIISGSGGQVLGYATFPGAPATIDGIVMLDDATGTPQLSEVITHEMGHFFNLYHTFQGSNGPTNCPSNTNCSTQGDLVCDTRAHSFLNAPVWFPCDESQYLNCDAAPYQNLVVENHMNYTGNSCRDEFTPEQSTRMRVALQTLRPGLLNSLCCVPGCTSVTADFNSSATNVIVGDVVDFVNASTPSNGTLSYEWTVEGNTFTTTDLLNYQFNNFGTFAVCLTASDGVCINQYCELIEVGCVGSPNCDQIVDCDNLVANGNFSVNCAGQMSQNLNNIEVCNWMVKFVPSQASTPRFCTDFNGANSMILAEWEEAIVTQNPVPMVVGEQYRLSFQYLRVSNGATNEPNELYFGFDYNPTLSEAYPYSNHLLLGTLQNLPIDQIGNYNTCQNPLLFNNFDVKFTYDGGTPPHLFFHYGSSSGTQTYMHIQNIVIECCDVLPPCTPLPDFTVDVDCPSIFTGTNAGDGDDYVWTFCDGTTQNGQVVTADLPEGDCEVCLTVFCAFDISATVCKTVTIEECPDSCLTVDILEVFCDDNGTTDPNDDFWYFDMTVTDNTGNGVYWTTDGDVMVTGPYIDVKRVWPGGTIMNNMSVTFRVYDAINKDCFVEVTVDAPPKCSRDCKLEVKEKTYCKIENDVAVYYVDLDVYVAPGECFMVVKKNANGIDEVLYTGSGTTTSITIGPFSPSEEFVLWVKLCDYFDCVVDLYIKPPKDCRNCIDYHIKNIACYDNGTSDPTDDYWTFDIFVLGPNSYWKAGYPINEAGPYDECKTIWVSDFNDVCFYLYDNKKKCRRKVCVAAPEPCSRKCKFEVDYNITDCKRKGEGEVFYIELSIASSAIECFTIKKKNADGSDQVLGDYPANTNITLGPFTPGEDFTLWIMGCKIFDCVRDIYIKAPTCEKPETTNRDDVNLFDVSMYPNPASDILRLESKDIIKSYRLLNATGMLQEKQQALDNNVILDISRLQNGLYFIEMESISGDRIIKKLYKVN